MSLSQSGGELRRATQRGELPTGGTVADIRATQADEDRRLVGMLFSKNADKGFLEVSFSSAEAVSNGGNNARSSTVAIFSGQSQEVDWLNLDWSEGEELHLHSRNNTGSAIQYTVTFYYEELS